MRISERFRRSDSDAFEELLRRKNREKDRGRSKIGSDTAIKEFETALERFSTFGNGSGMDQKTSRTS